MQQQQQNNPIRVMVLDDHSLFRRGIVRLLEATPGITVVADCSAIQEAVAMLDDRPIDVVLLDYDLGAERGSEFVMLAKQRQSTAKVLVVTAGVTDRQALDLMQQGVAGIFLKADSPEALVDAIRQVMSGEAWLKQDHLQLLLHGLSEPGSSDEKQMTARERAVLRGVVEGLANKEIAGELQISESSVKATLQQLFNKTGVRTRSQLVRIALERYRELVV